MKVNPAVTTALQQICKLFSSIIFDAMTFFYTNVAMFYMLNFVSTEPSKYFFQQFYDVMLKFL